MLAVMRHVGLLALVVAGACTAADPDVRIERQASTLADATDEGWLVGGAVVVGEPGSVTFPQHVALRITLVDSNTLDAEGNATRIPIDSVSLESTGLAAGDLSVEPACDAMACTAELLVLEAGSTMLEVVATRAGSDEGDCWYYAAQEDADPAATAAALRSDLEAQQTTCRDAVQKRSN